jgi:hypothetical protein
MLANAPEQAAAPPGKRPVWRSGNSSACEQTLIHKLTLAVIELTLYRHVGETLRK